MTYQFDILYKWQPFTILYLGSYVFIQDFVLTRFPRTDRRSSHILKFYMRERTLFSEERSLGFLWHGSKAWLFGKQRRII